MKLNIFSVPTEGVAALKVKLGDVGLKVIHQGEMSGWQSAFYFLENPEPAPIPWVATYAEYFEDNNLPMNLIYFSAYIFEKDDKCYALSYGKAHFYIRQFCDHDFGIEIVKRIGDDSNTLQTSVRRFNSKRKKQIRSLARGTALDLESGEAVEYLQTEIALDYQAQFGRSAKFGSSILLNAPIEKDGIGDLFDNIDDALTQEARFTLPRTTTITDPDEVARYDALLLGAITGGSEDAQFTHEGHDVVGVDFVFRGNERFTLTCRGYKKLEVGDGELGIEDLRTYIQEQGIPKDKILDIRLRVENEGQKPYSGTLKASLDFVVDGENVMLTQGHWRSFNEDYLDQLHASVDGIFLEATEPDFQYIIGEEGAFNEAAGKVGYVNADKDFSVIVTSASTKVEAWDLLRDSTVYAVKRGPAQKVGYVCDQANLTLEIIRNNANLKKLDQEVKAYCLWFIFARTTPISKISEIDSIILKQKIDDWARRCRELGIEPRLKFSRCPARTRSHAKKHV